MKRFSSLPLLLFGFALAAPSLQAAETSTADQHRGPSCLVQDHYFENEVWPKVAAESCLKCHKVGGDAEETKLVLEDPSRDASPGQTESLKHNRAAFAKLAASMHGDQSRLLLKAIGGLEHDGKEAVKPNSPEYRILAEFVRRVIRPQEAAPAWANDAAMAKDGAAFFDGLAMLDNRALLRRLTLSLAGRLPSDEENARIQKGGREELSPILDGVMKEEAFYDRLAEAFNDIFLTRGYDGVPETALSYDHFGKTRGWAEKYDLSAIKDEKERRKAGYKLSADYREALLREPMELVKYIVRNNHPFSEIVTADYIMVSPYTARGYGVFEDIKGQFKNTEDPFEFIPLRLKALQSRNLKENEVTPTGFYPHAGMLTTFQYLRRYPTTETNRNRLRARMYYQQFLGIDVLELAARVTDAAAVQAKFEIPTMQASECVVCHKIVDPVASLFQDFYNLEGTYGIRKEGWFKDMFAAGLEGEDMPSDQKWRALQWLGERTAKDPRFARTMVEHVYYVLTGRKALLPPKALDDPLYEAKRHAYAAQHREVQRIADQFVKANCNLKVAFKEWASSPFYRVDCAATVAKNLQRRSELYDVGLARMLSPEQLERKIAAIFGQPWGKLKDKETAMLYGGIDSKEVTERAADPSGAMGAVQRIMANEVASRNVGWDFSLPAEQRKLFRGIDPSVALEATPQAEEAIRQEIVGLHQLVLGRYDAPHSREVNRTYDLFTGIVRDAQARGKFEPLDIYDARGADGKRINDPHYTVRAWRAVLTYLLRQQEFLYE